MNLAWSHKIESRFSRTHSIRLLFPFSWWWDGYRVTCVDLTSLWNFTSMSIFGKKLGFRLGLGHDNLWYGSTQSRRSIDLDSLLEIKSKQSRNSGAPVSIGYVSYWPLLFSVNKGQSCSFPFLTFGTILPTPPLFRQFLHRTNIMRLDRVHFFTDRTIFFVFLPQLWLPYLYGQADGGRHGTFRGSRHCSSRSRHEVTRHGCCSSNHFPLTECGC